MQIGIGGAVALLPSEQTRSVRVVEARSWPPHRYGTPLALHRARSTAEAGRLLRTAGTTSVWPHLDTAAVLEGLAARVLNPSAVYQAATQFCGPSSVVFELARRAPHRYVELALALLRTGKATSNGRVLQTTDHLRQQPLPAKSAACDWLVTASLRDDENWLVAIDEGDSWLSGLSTFGELRGWQRDVLLDANASWQTCFSTGEADALRAAVSSLTAHGSGFLCIDANLIHDGGTDDEEQVGWVRRQVAADGSVSVVNAAHSKDDGYYCDHWVALVGASMPPGIGDHSTKTVVLDLWSWGSLYTVTGSMDAISEYLYGVAVGTPQGSSSE